MQTIFISATMRHSGQSLITWLLASELIERGRKVGVFRPMGLVGPGGGPDPILQLLSESLGDKLAAPPVCPLCVDPEGGVDPDLVEFHITKIEQAFSQLKDQCDVCLAVGSRDVFFDAEHSSLPDARFIEMFDARVLLIDRFVTKAMTVYSTLALASFLRERLAGILINRVTDSAWDEFLNETKPFLQEKGAPVLAVLPEDVVIESPTLHDLKDLLEADVLTGEEKLDNQTTGVTISAQSLPASMKIYKRVVNKVLLEGASTANLISGEQKGICGVVLTGGRIPADQVVRTAQAEGLPVLLTRLDTFAVIEKMGKGKILIQARDRFRLDRLKSLLEQQVSIDQLIAACGL